MLRLQRRTLNHRGSLRKALGKLEPLRRIQTIEEINDEILHGIRAVFCRIALSQIVEQLQRRRQIIGICEFHQL